jgi:predicted MFS family arabinose efflux permease
MLGCVLGGAGNGVQLVSVVQAVQDRVDDDFQARVMGLLESINAAALGTGFVLGGLVTGLTDPRVTFALSGTGALLAALGARGALRGARTVEPAGLAPAPEPQPAR